MSEATSQEAFLERVTQFNRQIGSKVSRISTNGTIVPLKSPDQFPLVKPFRQRSLPLLAKRYQSKNKKQPIKEHISQPKLKEVRIPFQKQDQELTRESEPPTISVSLRNEAKQEPTQPTINVFEPDSDIVDTIGAMNSPATQDMQIDTVCEKEPVKNVTGEDSSSVNSLRRYLKRQLFSHKGLTLSLLREVTKIVKNIYLESNDKHLEGLLGTDLQDYDMMQSELFKQKHNERAFDYNISSTGDPEDVSHSKIDQLMERVKYHATHTDVLYEDAGTLADGIHSWEPKADCFSEISSPFRLNHQIRLLTIKPVEMLGSLGPDMESEDYQKRVYLFHLAIKNEQTKRVC